MVWSLKGREKANVAYFDARGVGETRWDPALQWHIRIAAAWTGQTIVVNGGSRCDQRPANCERTV